MTRLDEFFPGGFNCSQVILNMALDDLGKENGMLIRSMQAFGGGLGSTGHICGALLGGVCLLSLHAGKENVDDRIDENLNFMVAELVEWFKQEYGSSYGGMDCDQILEGNLLNIPQRCPDIILDVYNKTQEILNDHGYDTKSIKTDQ